MEQHNGQKKQYKWTNNDLQNIHTQKSTTHVHKTKDRETRTSLKTAGDLRCPGRVSSSCSTYPSGTTDFTTVFSGVRVTRSLVFLLTFYGF
jgi:hypothetical protein